MNIEDKFRNRLLAIRDSERNKELRNYLNYVCEKVGFLRDYGVYIEIREGIIEMWMEESGIVIELPLPDHDNKDLVKWSYDISEATDEDIDSLLFGIRLSEMEFEKRQSWEDFAFSIIDTWYDYLIKYIK